MYWKISLIETTWQSYIYTMDHGDKPPSLLEISFAKILYIFPTFQKPLLESRPNVMYNSLNLKIGSWLWKGLLESWKNRHTYMMTPLITSLRACFVKMYQPNISKNTFWLLTNGEAKKHFSLEVYCMKECMRG